jgi:hypothetical protein
MTRAGARVHGPEGERALVDRAQLGGERPGTTQQ